MLLPWEVVALERFTNRYVFILRLQSREQILSLCDYIYIHFNRAYISNKLKVSNASSTNGLDFVYKPNNCRGLDPVFIKQYMKRVSSMIEFQQQNKNNVQV